MQEQPLLPLERLVQGGPRPLSDAELLVVLLDLRGRALAADTILSALGDLAALAEADVQDLMSLRGIGQRRAGRLIAAAELGRRMLTRPLPRGERLRGAEDVDAALRPRLARESVEHFLAIPLDAKHRPFGEVPIARGGLTGCAVEPADVFRSLLRRRAAAVVFVHNHPSGLPEPSPEDLALTHRLARAGDLLGVSVVDHVIIGAEGFFSFRDAGLMEPGEARCC